MGNADHYVFAEDPARGLHLHSVQRVAERNERGAIAFAQRHAVAASKPGEWRQSKRFHVGRKQHRLHVLKAQLEGKRLNQIFLREEVAFHKDPAQPGVWLFFLKRQRHLEIGFMKIAKLHQEGAQRNFQNVRTQRFADFLRFYEMKLLKNSDQGLWSL